jgi:hypothetical protein
MSPPYARAGETVDIECVVPIRTLQKVASLEK